MFSVVAICALFEPVKAARGCPEVRSFCRLRASPRRARLEIEEGLFEDLVADL
jgi:hypothetical protein